MLSFVEVNAYKGVYSLIYRSAAKYNQETGDIPVARTGEPANLRETLKEFEELIKLSPFF